MALEREASVSTDHLICTAPERRVGGGMTGCAAWAAMSSRVLCVDGLDVCGCRALTLHARGRAIVSLESDWGRQRTLIGIG